MSTNKSTWKKLTSMRLFMPLVCLLAIIIVATITIPGFLSMSLKNGVPYGYPVDVINRASELVILSVGMTIVIISGGFDLSVGSNTAMCGAVALIVSNSTGSVLLGLLGALVVGLLFGTCNGLIVKKIGINALITTCLLYTSDAADE